MFHKLFQYLNKSFNRTCFSFWIVYRLSALLSFLYVFQTKQTAKLPDFTHFQTVEAILDALAWNPDEFFILGQRIPHFWMRSAEEVQWYLDHKIMPTIDCDEAALYAAKALQTIEEAFAPRILTVRWVDPKGDVGGHNVCLYSYSTQTWRQLYGHMGNWGHFRGFNSPSQIATSIANTVGGKLISYATATADLKLTSHEKVS